MVTAQAMAEAEAPVVEAPPALAPLRDQLSPFLRWSEEDRRPLPALSAPASKPGWLARLLCDPSGTVADLAGSSGLQRTILRAVAVLATSTAVFALLTGQVLGSHRPLVNAAFYALWELAALAAAAGPVYGTGLVLGARVPLSRLVALLLASAATGVTLLASLSPLVLVIVRAELFQIGAVTFFALVFLGGAVAAARFRNLLHLFARGLSPGHEALSREDAERVATLARVAAVVTAFTSTMAFWLVSGFDG